MLDPERQLVGRALPPGYFGSDQTVMRKSYLKHVPCPAPIAIEDDRILIEEFIHGEHFDGLELTRKIDVCKVIYRCYADLVLNEGRRSSKTILDVLCDDKVLLNLHPEPRRRLRNLEERLPGIGNWPQVPTSPDSGSNNIIVARGEQPYFIDYLPLRLLPFFYTPVWVIAWSRDAGLRARYFEGEFDSELQVLFDAAGIAYAPNRETRETLVALTLLFKCVRYLGTLNGPHVSGRDRHDHVLIADKVNGYVAKCGLDKARSWC